PTIQRSDNIADLNTLSIDLFQLINGVIKRQPAKRVFVIFDALPAMQLYISPEQFLKFLHATNLRLRALNVYQLYIIDGTKDTTNTIKQFCDTVLELTAKPEEEFAAALGANA
ncbi:MAG: hypothetical protein AABY13_03740, partial [Nanoarchaeota archaeon]